MQIEVWEHEFIRKFRDEISLRVVECNNRGFQNVIKVLIKCLEC